MSKKMKNSFAKIYAIYFLSLLTTNFVPTFMMKIGADKMTKPFTLAFSNTPGILRKIRTTPNCVTEQLISSFICAGRLPISIAIISYAEKLEFSVLMDTCVNVEPS